MPNENVYMFELKRTEIKRTLNMSTIT